MVKSQATRSQSQNESIARRLLVDRIEELEKGEQSRNAIKADRARKKKASKVKKSRRKYRELGPDKIDNENDVEREREEPVGSPAEDTTEQQTQGR